MRTDAPPLLPLLRSQVQGNLLALTYLAPEREFTVTEAARGVRASVKAVHHEVNRLVQAGLLADRRQGNNRLIRAVTDSVLSGPLTDLLAVSYGPLPVLTAALRGAPGVQRAYIYGSWAARYCGEPGPIPADVDVLAIGTADLNDLYDVARTAELRLRREVNIQLVRPDTWERPHPEEDDLFLTTLRSRPLVELDLVATTLRERRLPLGYMWAPAPRKPSCRAARPRDCTNSTDSAAGISISWMTGPPGRQQAAARTGTLSGARGRRRDV
jgi:hypothetical protein